MSPARTALVALLVVSTAAFAVGVLAERSRSDAHHGPATTQQRSEAGEAEGAHGEGGEASHAHDGETLFGIDLESTPLLILAVIAGLGLAGTCATQLGERPGVLLAVAAIALAWAVLDVREVVHQLDESDAGLALLALGVAILHAAAAALAARLATRARDADEPARQPPSAAAV